MAILKVVGIQDIDDLVDYTPVALAADFVITPICLIILFA